MSSLKPVVIELTDHRGRVKQERFMLSMTTLLLTRRFLVAVSADIAQLTRVANLCLNYNCFEDVPAILLQMTQLRNLDVRFHHLLFASHLTTMASRQLGFNALSRLPPSISQLTGLSDLLLMGNQLVSLPREADSAGCLREPSHICSGRIG
jgi:Leucine-rich repeat (LRR) protein